MLKLYFQFLRIVLKILKFGKSDKDESFREQAKPTNFQICFLLSSVIVNFFNENCLKHGGRTKQPILNEKKPPISETGQKRRFRK